MSALTRLTLACAALACAATIASTASAQAPPPRLASDPPPADSAGPENVPSFHMVRGFITTADRRAARGLVARVKTSTGEQVSAIKADGTFQVIAPAGEGAIQIVIDVHQGDRWYFPSWTSVEPERIGREHGFVLIPRVWQIPAGKYEGQWAEVNLDKAFQNVAPTINHAFYMWQIDRAVDATDRDKPNSWGLDALPIPVVFDRDSSAVTIEAVDSAGFWGVLDGMEQEFGLDLYEPRRAEDLAGDESGSDRMIRVWIPEGMSRWIAGRASSDRDGKVLRKGWVTIQRRRWLRDHYLVKHEFMHALGFGHTCAWPSVVSGPGCDKYGVDESSLFDVSHVHLSLNVNALQRRTGARYGLVAAWNGQRRVMNQQVSAADK